MESKEYPYIHCEYNNETLGLQPAFVVDLSKNGEVMSNHIAIVDSGAYITMADASIADVLKIDKTTCKEHDVSGFVGETVKGFECNVHIKIPQYDDPFEIPIVFVPDLNTGILLGQIGFFDQFRITFDRNNNLFELTCIEAERMAMEGIGDIDSFAVIKK